MVKGNGEPLRLTGPKAERRQSAQRQGGAGEKQRGAAEKARRAERRPRGDDAGPEEDDRVPDEFEVRIPRKKTPGPLSARRTCQDIY
jgi:hypothetical protein